MDNPDIQQIIREEVRRAVRWQPLVQLGIQVVVQGLAYGITFIFIWELRSQIQDVPRGGQESPGSGRRRPRPRAAVRRRPLTPPPCPRP